jgi:dihydrofolate reductase
LARLIVFNVVTVDGYFEGPDPGSIDWHPWSEDLETLSLDQLHSAGGLLFGRKTYQGMADYWKAATGEIAELMNSLPKAVVSTTLTSPDWHNTRALSGLADVATWKSETSRDLYVFGSADLIDGLLEAGLVDELRLGIAPLVLGRGNPLFKPRAARRPLTLIDATQLKLGCVLLRYAVTP